MKKITIFTFIFFLLSFIFCKATVRYVSHTGTDTPPYTSWETAADSIMSAINISSFGDTIYVANGFYEEQVVMIPGLSLIGAGMDSCVIDMTNRTNYVTAVEMKDSCFLQGFNIRFCYICPPGVRGLGINMDFSQDTVKGCIVRYNKIDYSNEGIWVTEGNISHNIINQAVFAVTCATLEEQGNYIADIDSNFISFYFTGIKCASYTKINSRNNIFLIEANNYTDGRVLYNDILSQNTQTNFSNNNILKSTNEIIFQRGISNAFPGNFTNNQFLTKYENVFYTAPATIKNNNIIGSLNGIYGDTTGVKYNNFWKVINYPRDSTNISANPMFEDEDSLNFHLQRYSPLIDAGDPAILDKDSSRSDIGLFGGPYGESYKYIDLPPGIPTNFTATVDSPEIKLTWNKNSEADFNYYRVYRDTIEGFDIDSSNLAAELQDTFYIQQLPFWNKNYYFKITAVDNQENESEPSQELFISITSIVRYPLSIRNYSLYQNYPNPFNLSTKIGYSLTTAGYVKIYVYDITGSTIALLVNEEKGMGYHEVEFAAKNDLASGIYLYKIDVLDSNRKIPVFTEIKKMILLK